MATDDQNAGLDGRSLFAGDTLPLDFTVATAASASGVTAAEWGLFRLPPSEATGDQTALLSKTLGAGITMADGTPGNVVVSVDVLEGETENFPGLHYHELKITASGDTYRVARGQVWLQHGAL